MPVVYIEMYKGRTMEQKRELAGEITESIHRIAGVRTEAIQVIFLEIEKENWAIGGKISE